LFADCTISCPCATCVFVRAEIGEVDVGGGFNGEEEMAEAADMETLGAGCSLVACKRSIVFEGCFAARRADEKISGMCVKLMFVESRFSVEARDRARRTMPMVSDGSTIE